jgi:hypothetical protein
MSSLQVQITIAGLPLDYSSEGVRHHVRSHCRGFTIVSWLCTSDGAVIVLKFSNTDCLASSLDRLTHARFQGRRLVIMVVRERINSVVREAIASTRSVSCTFGIVISRLSRCMNLDELKNHVQSHIEGRVLSFEVGISQSRATKVTCLIQTLVTAKSATLRLRQATFQGRSLEIEILSSGEACRVGKTLPSKSIPQSPSASSIPGSSMLTVLISKLPLIVDMVALTNHVRSHAGGTVVSLNCSKSLRGGMKAVVVIVTNHDALSVIARLKNGRFQGINVYVELVQSMSAVQLLALGLPALKGAATLLSTSEPPTNNVLNGITKPAAGYRVDVQHASLPTSLCRPDMSSSLEPSIGSNANRVDDPSSDRLDIPQSTSYTHPCFTAPLPATQNKLVKVMEPAVDNTHSLMGAISSSFSRFVTARRCQGIEDENDMEKMFAEYLVKRLLVTPNRNETRHGVDESPEMCQRPLTVVDSASIPPTGVSLGAAPARSVDSNIKMEDLSNHDAGTCTHPAIFVDATIRSNDQSLTISILDLEEELGLSKISFQDLGRKLANDEDGWSVLS